MGTPPIKPERAQTAWDIVLECVNDGYVIGGMPSAFEEAARRSVARGFTNTRSAFQTVLRRARDLGLDKAPEEPIQQPREISPEDVETVVKNRLRSGPRTIDELMRAASASSGAVLDAIERLSTAGTTIRRHGDHFEISVGIQPAYASGHHDMVVIESRPDNTFVFGVAGDKHIGSKYHRDDVLADLYRRFEEAGVDAVFDTGNWIEGDARFNRHDLVAHGLHPQVALMAENHPRIEGVTTYAVWGDDHEGWCAQREGVDVGMYAEQVMQAAGHDWRNLGFMEAHVVLRNVHTGAEAMMAVVHPGGGSAYAVSYSIQKIIESLDGGEKPAVGLYGHYHKLWAGNIRNVWCLQSGTSQDQTPFMRKKKIEAHVGGSLLTMEQDPETGAIIGFMPQMVRYFNKGYYNGRWSRTSVPARAQRSVAGV